MSTNYTGNPAITQTPSLAPGPGIIPVIVLPADGDAANAASVAQMVKVPADYLAYYAYPNRVESLRERWDIAPQTITSVGAGVINDLQKRWSYYIAAGTTQTCTFNNPSTAIGYPARTVTLNLGTGNAAQHSSISTTFPVWLPPTVPYRCLLEFDFQATTSTLNSREYHLGWGLGTSPGVLGDAAVFLNDYTQANWQIMCSSGPVTTSVPVAIGSGVSTWVRMAILIDTTLATPAALFYINGALVGTITTNLPSNAGAGYCLYFAGRQVTSGVASFTVGDVVMTYTKF